MDVFGGSGNYASGPLSLGTNVKDKESFSHNGQTAGICSGSSLQVTNVHTSEYNQKNPTHWETSRGSVQILTGQSLETSSLPGGKSLLQKCLNPNINKISSGDSCSSNIPYDHQNASSASVAINSSQQPIRKNTVVNTWSLRGNWNNQCIPKQHVNTLTYVSSHCSQKEMLIHNGSIRLLFVAPDKVIQLQEICQYKNVPQKAIAVVTPLKQQVAVGIAQSKIFTGVNKKGLEAGSVPKKPYQRILPKTIPSGLTSNDVKTDIPKELNSVFTSEDSQQVESGKHASSKRLSTNGLIPLNNVVQTDIPQESQSESTAVFQTVGSEKHPRNEELSSSTLQSLDSVNLTSSQCGFPLQTIPAGEVFQHEVAKEQTEQLSSQRKKSMPPLSVEEEIQFSDIKDPCSSDFSEQYNVHNSPTSPTTGMSGELPDEASVMPVTEWSLQRLYSFIIELERLQKQQLKDFPCSCVTQEILNLYWNGDYKIFCNASNTSLYLDILKEMFLYHGKNDSVIFKEMDLNSKETNNVAEFHILKHDDAPPKMIYQKSSWLNLSEMPPDIDDDDEDDDEYSTFTRMSHSKSQIDDLEKVHGNPERSEKETTDVDKKTNTEVEQRKPLSPEHRTSGVNNDKVVRTEPLCINNKNGQSNCVKAKVVQNNVQWKELPETEDHSKVNNLSTSQSSETTSQQSSGNNSPAVSGCHIAGKQRNILPPLMSTVSPQLDKSAAFDPFACVQIKVLSPNKSKEVFARKPAEEEVDKKQENLVETEMKSKCQIIIDLPDQMSGDKMQTKTEITKDEGNKSLNQVIKVPSQIESYCCIAKWFKVLGYQNQGHCMCEQKAILNGDGEADVKIVDVISDHQEVANLANTVFKPMAFPPLVSHHFTESGTLYRSDTGQKRRIHHTSYSQHAFDKSLHSSMDSVCVQLDKHNGEKITTTQDNTARKTIHLALYGSFNQRKYKSVRSEHYLRKGFSGTVPHPPETLNIKVGSDCRTNSSTERKRNVKQRNLSTCKKSYVQSKKLVNETQLQICENDSDLEKNASDKSVTSHESSAFGLVKALPLQKSHKQTHKSESTKYQRRFSSTDQQRNLDQSKEMLHVTREDKTRKLKQRRKLASQNYDKRKPNGSLFKTKRKDDATVALDFRVLPDSFNLTDVSPTEAYQSASADCGSNNKNVTGMKRPLQSAGAWCISPKKKCHLESSATAATSTSSSTFLEFKRKFEKKQRLPS